MPYPSDNDIPTNVVFVVGKQFSFGLSASPILDDEQYQAATFAEPVDVPAGRLVEFRVTSFDVNHGFSLYSPAGATRRADAGHARLCQSPAGSPERSGNIHGAVFGNVRDGAPSHARHHLRQVSANVETPMSMTTGTISATAEPSRFDGRGSQSVAPHDVGLGAHGAGASPGARRPRFRTCGCSSRTSFPPCRPEWFYAVLTLHSLGMVGAWFVGTMAGISYLLSRVHATEPRSRQVRLRGHDRGRPAAHRLHARRAVRGRLVLPLPAAALRTGRVESVGDMDLLRGARRTGRVLDGLDAGSPASYRPTLFTRHGALRALPRGTNDTGSAAVDPDQHCQPDRQPRRLRGGRHRHRPVRSPGASGSMSTRC